jgi:hypothetical protein
VADGNLYCDCEELIPPLKPKPDAQAATKDDAMMEPASGRVEGIAAVSVFRGPTSQPIRLGGRALDILIALARKVSAERTGPTAKKGNCGNEAVLSGAMSGQMCYDLLEESANRHKDGRSE